MQDMPTRKDPVAARQGKTNVGVRYVLIAGLVLVVIALGLAALLTR